MSIQEYNRFGPWVLEITGQDPAPALFLPHLDRSRPALLSFKIPRQIERREATPGMNLYDYLVSLFPEELEILQRVGETVRRTVISYQDIQSIALQENLLQGQLVIQGANQFCSLPFSSVSSDLMQRALNLIRARYTTAEPLLETESNSAFQPKDLSFFFSKLLSQQKVQHPGLALLAYQPEIPISKLHQKPLPKTLSFLLRSRLLESLHLSDGVELWVIDRGSGINRYGRPVYAKHVRYFPLHKGPVFAWEDHPRIPGIIQLRIHSPGVEGNLPRFLFSRENRMISEYQQYLNRIPRI